MPTPEEFLQSVPDPYCKPLLPRLRRALRLDYEVKAAIGAGGMGEVHEAVDRQFGRQVALKRLRADLVGDEAARQYFLQESEITATLEHPSIVPVHRFLLDDQGRPGYVMRLIRQQTSDACGQTAGEIEDRCFGDFSADIAHFHGQGRTGNRATGVMAPDYRGIGFSGLLGHFRRVCDVVAFAHSRGIIHRDLKPTNIITGPFGETFVLDWGLAKRFSEGGPAEVATSPSDKSTPS